MASITKKRLQAALLDAYEQGYRGALDMQENCVEGILATLLGSDPESTDNQNDGWRVFTVKELRATKIGTIFEHSTLGKGWIDACNTMTWASGGSHLFQSDNQPWTEPMRIIGMTSKSQPRQTIKWDL